MTGQAITELMYLVAQAVQGELRRVQVWVEDNHLMMRCVGVTRIDPYEKLMGRANFIKLQEHCRWDEQFTAWKTPISMRDDIKKPLINTRKLVKLPPKTNE